MARRRINQSKSRREWRRQRAETLARLRALVRDAFFAYKKWTRRLITINTDAHRQNELIRRLHIREKRRWKAYRDALNDR